MGVIVGAGVGNQLGALVGGCDVGGCVGDPVGCGLGNRVGFAVGASDVVHGAHAQIDAPATNKLELHPELEYALNTIEVTESGIVNETSAVQDANALPEIAVTLGGMVTAARLVHCRNAEVPINVGPDGIDTIDKLAQSKK